jgi:lipopolysaccharide biosynthesis glycosyltransferase
MTLYWHVPDPRRLVGLPLWGRMTVTTYNKLLAPELVPLHITKALWLDADVLAQADLEDLWTGDLGNAAVRAARDPVVGSVGARFGVAGWRELGLDPGARYFNAGVLVMDLAKWRAEDIGVRALEYVRRHWRRVYFWDQEGLNAVLAGRWTPLEPAWNWSPSLGAPGVAPRLVHFAGNLKPWRYRGRSRWHELYYAEVDRTGWRSWRPGPSPGGWLSWYGASPLRGGLRPIERCHMAFTRWRTLRMATASDLGRQLEGVISA